MSVMFFVAPKDTWHGAMVLYVSLSDINFTMLDSPLSERSRVANPKALTRKRSSLYQTKEGEVQWG